MRQDFPTQRYRILAAPSRSSSSLNFIETAATRIPVVTQHTPALQLVHSPVRHALATTQVLSGIFNCNRPVCSLRPLLASMRLELK